MIDPRTDIQEKQKWLAEQLALLYLEKFSTSGLSPAKFAHKYLDVKKEIFTALPHSQSNGK